MMMLPEELSTAVNAIRDSGKKVYIIATGAGAGIQKYLWDAPGISSTLVGASFPYATSDTDAILGFKPDRYATLETAIDLAQEAYIRAWSPGVEAVGLGLSAAVASTYEHKGEHRVYVAAVTSKKCHAVSATLVKGSGYEHRIVDGDVSDLLGLRLLAYQATDERYLTESLKKVLREKVMLYIDGPENEKALARFFEHPYFRANGTRQFLPDPTEELTLFPGAFNPPHAGHLGIANTVLSKVGKHVTFEVSIDSAHKPALTLSEMLERAKLLKGHDRLFTSGCPLFKEKAVRFPNSHFVVGADTLQRMYDPKWCEDPKALTQFFLDHGAQAIVFGRKIGDTFVESRTAVTRDMRPFVHYYLDDRWDISSSEVRSSGSSK